VPERESGHCGREEDHATLVIKSPLPNLSPSHYNKLSQLLFNHIQETYMITSECSGTYAVY
jgi:hypothetical protein